MIFDPVLPPIENQLMPEKTHWGISKSAAPILCNFAKMAPFANINEISGLRTRVNFVQLNENADCAHLTSILASNDLLKKCSPRQSRHFLKTGQNQRRQKPMSSPSLRHREPKKRTECHFLKQRTRRTHCEFEGFIENRIQGFPVNFCLKFLLVVGKEMHTDVGVRKSVQVHRGEVLTMVPEMEKRADTADISVLFFLKLC